MTRPLFDPVIHAPARLQIMAVLMTCGPDQRVEFTRVRQLLGLTDGNLGTHLLTLERAGYVTIYKDFAGKRPRTSMVITPTGRNAYVAHAEQLRMIISEPTPRRAGSVMADEVIIPAFHGRTAT